MNRFAFAQVYEKDRIKVAEEFYYSACPKDSILHPFYNSIIFYEQPNFGSKQIYKSNSFNLLVKFKESLPQKVNFNGVLGNWYKVLCKTPNKLFYAYVPKQVFAISVLNFNDTKYLLGVTGYYQGFGFTYQVNILEDYQLQKQYQFSNSFNLNYHDRDKSMEFTPYLHFELYNNKGLSKVKHILKISTYGEACGVWGGVNYLLIDEKNEVKSQLQTKYMGDADAFYHNEYFYFPVDSSALQDEIIKKTEVYELLYNDKDEETNTEIVLRKKWNLNTFVTTDSIFKKDTTVRPPDLIDY